MHCVVVTDFDAHAMWLCRHYDFYFVALEETKEHLRSLGITPQNIAVSGIPIDPIFSLPKSKIEMREKYGLSQDMLTVIVSAGGFGVGPNGRAVSVPGLDGASHTDHSDVRQKRSSPKAARVDCAGPFEEAEIKPIGFTKSVDEYMAAADLLLGKPGGLTTAEALSKGLVFVIVNPIPGQEERNSDHLLEEGVGIRCNNLSTLAYKLDLLVADKARLAGMKANALRLAHPLAVAEIASKLLQQQPAAHQGTVCGSEHVCYNSVLAATFRAARRRLQSQQLKFIRTLKKQRGLNLRMTFKSNIK